MKLQTLVGAAAMAALVLGGCSEAADTGDVDTSSAPKADNPKKPGKYEQTWPKKYANTTCREWNNRMDDHQQWVAAADMLINVQQVDDPNVGLPSDALIDEFRGGMTTACVIPNRKITEVGAALYLTERDRFEP